MINFLAFLMVGVFLGCWLLVVADHQVKAVYKLILTFAMVCIGGMINKIHPINVLGVVGLILGCIGILISVVAAKATGK